MRGVARVLVGLLVMAAGVAALGALMWAVGGLWSPDSATDRWFGGFFTLFGGGVGGASLVTAAHAIGGDVIESAAKALPKPQKAVRADTTPEERLPRAVR